MRVILSISAALLLLLTPPALSIDSSSLRGRSEQLDQVKDEKITGHRVLQDASFLIDSFVTTHTDMVGTSSHTSDRFHKPGAGVKGCGDDEVAVGFQTAVLTDKSGGKRFGQFRLMCDKAVDHKPLINPVTGDERKSIVLAASPSTAMAYGNKDDDADPIEFLCPPGQVLVGIEYKYLSPNTFMYRKFVAFRGICQALPGYDPNVENMSVVNLNDHLPDSTVSCESGTRIHTLGARSTNVGDDPNTPPRGVTALEFGCV